MKTGDSENAGKLKWRSICSPLLSAWLARAWPTHSPSEATIALQGMSSPGTDTPEMMLDTDEGCKTDDTLLPPVCCCPATKIFRVPLTTSTIVRSKVFVQSGVNGRCLNRGICCNESDPMARG